MGKKLLSTVIALNLCAPLFAAGAVSEADIYRWLALWQKREGLEHFNINLVFTQQKELGIGPHGNHVLADVRSWPGDASIRFAYPEELERVWGWTPQEARWWAEEGVIHELLHVVIKGLYADTSDDPDWLMEDHALDLRMENITDNLAQMLMRRRAPNGLTVARYISREINSGPWKPAPDVRERVMLQVVRAMNAAMEDDVVMLARR